MILIHKYSSIFNNFNIIKEEIEMIFTIKSILLIIHLILRAAAKSVPICNPDFEEYGMSYTTSGDFISWRYFASNYSCWYNLIGQQIEIKSVWSPFSSFTAELAHNVPYILCQNILLE